MKPMLKALTSQCLKLEHDKLLSNFAFKLNLRRYIQVLGTTHRYRSKYITVVFMKPGGNPQ
jgi:hypothetical protein